MDFCNLSCSICLDLQKDPVTIPCGHSYCRNCIKEHWDREDQKRIHSCPQCRKEFTPRPVLVKNIMLAELVEDLKKTGLQTAPADHHNKHLQPHYDSLTFKKHKIQCVCYLCSMDEHQGHETVPAAQKQVQVRREQIQQRIQDQEKDVKLLQQEVEAINVSADKAVEDTEKIFSEMMRLIQKRSSDVKQQIRSQQETEVSRVKELQEKLEQEIPELKRKDAELEQLSDIEDHNQFLLNYPSLSALSESTHSSSINIRPLRYFEDVTAAVSELREKLQDILNQEQTKTTLPVTKVDAATKMDAAMKVDPVMKVDVLQSEQEPTTRADFLKYSRKLTLNPDTAHKYLELSEGNRKVTMTNEDQCYSDDEDRFTRRWQVLSRSRLTGRYYWEVEWSGSSVEIAVAYRDIEREGDTNDSSFGMNENSWALCCSTTGYTFYSDGDHISIPGPVSPRVGVYLDHSAGILSFYSVFGGGMTLLHREITTFTEPLHAGIWLSRATGTTAEIIKFKK
uniref:Tripartite motif-containing protein 16 n=1 Tax=Fundulus heteroclitus TaxID=8078 RepID=A0A3Q2NV83_FUNHE